MIRTFKIVASVLVFASIVSAQPRSSKTISQADHIKILRAEDELRFDKTLEKFLKASNPNLRKRAALAAGRIGDEDAIPALSSLLNDDDSGVQQMAAFAIGEIESVKGANSIIGILLGRQTAARARAIEAAGKIAAANPKEKISKSLSGVILSVLKFEARRRSKPDEDVILLGLTAALRAKPNGADKIIAEFLGYPNWRIRADALNTLARLRAKNANDKAKELLTIDDHPVVRANAARVLGAAGDKSSVDLLVKAATSDQDLRVRINAIRALSSLKDSKSADSLMKSAEMLFEAYKSSKEKNPVEKNELLTIASALGNILKGTNNLQATNFLRDFRILEEYQSSEIEIAFVRISPNSYLKEPPPTGSAKDLWKRVNNFAPAMALYADPKIIITDQKATPVLTLKSMISDIVEGKTDNLAMAIPSLLSAYAAFKPSDLEKIATGFLQHKDFVVRDSAARLLGDIKPENPKHAAGIYRTLSVALWNARQDSSADASLAILGALEKQYENRPKPMTLKVPYETPFISALESPDYLVRRRSARVIRKQKFDRSIPKNLEVIKDWSESTENGSKTRVVKSNYKRALSRKNGISKAILATEKGEITIEFYPEEAPLTVDNFIKLAKSGYFDGVDIHRVVPNFVVQDGDPRGDGNGGPGWQIRCEINQIPYERGMVGMALSGKDTGGSQWFVTHSPQPHLDGGYTIFGKVNEADMKIVDNLVRGDKILSVRIEGKK